MGYSGRANPYGSGSGSGGVASGGVQWWEQGCGTSNHGDNRDDHDDRHTNNHCGTQDE